MDNLMAVLLGSALGVAASPLPIVALLIILLTRRATLGSLVFLASWVGGVTAAIVIAISFAGRVRVPHGLDLESEGIVTLLFGIGLLVTAWVSRRGRFRSADPEAAPRWVAAVDDLSPVGGALLAVSNAMTSPKNLALAISAGLAISQARLRQPGESAVTFVYIFVASLTILVPVVVYLLGGEASRAVLTRWKQVITARAAAIVEVTLFVFGVALAMKGVYNLVG